MALPHSRPAAAAAKAPQRLPVASLRLAAALLPLAAALIAAAVPAQGKDLRDEVELESGKVVRGRVLQPFDPDELVVAQGGKRVRIPKDKVAKTTTVRDRLREFLLRYDKAKDDAGAHFALAEWAEAQELHAMARLAALQVVMLDDSHEQAHELLGHRLDKKRGFLWPEGSRWLTRDAYDEHISKWGRALEIDSEHFTMRTDGGFRRAVLALIDLERLYVWLFDELGPQLLLEESLQPMHVKVWNSEDDFPAWSGARLPYFVPNPYADASHTFYRGADPRPADLFTVGTQQILYRSLARGADPHGEMERFCAWLEIGFGRWVEARFRGDPGHAELREHQIDPREPPLALQARRYTLKNLLHLTLRDHFYGGHLGRSRFYGTDTNVHWASAHMFVTFLMDESVDQESGARLLEYLRLALGEAKGDSSKEFDRAMGRRVEDFEQPFQSWLETKSGLVGQRR